MKRIFVAVFLAGAVPVVATATWMEQSVKLVKGWNAIHLKVNPVDGDCAKVFGEGSGNKIESVAWWRPDPTWDGTGAARTDTLYWNPTNSASCTFAQAIGDNTYLVKTTQALTLRVFGTPVIPSGRIYLGAANLVGMWLENDVYYSEYFRAFSKNLAPSPYQTVDPPDSNALHQGDDKSADPSQAVWLQTAGSGIATYMGPVQISSDSTDKILSWTKTTAVRTLTLKNVTDEDLDVKIDLLDSLAPPAGQGTKAGKIALKRERVDYSAGYARRLYDPMPTSLTTNIAAGATWQLRIRPNLDAMPAAGEGSFYLGILKISTALNEEEPAGVAAIRVGLSAAGNLDALRSPAGLWVGQVALTGVNRARMLKSAASEWNADDIQNATQPFQFRLILHAADDGEVKLLKQAFIGTRMSDDATATVMTDRRTARAYRGAYPNATIRRTSSANFPFMEPLLFTDSLNFMKDGGVMTATFTQKGTAKDNPFYHQFHPNHDSLAFNNGKPVWKEDGADGTGDYETWSVTRTVTLKFQGGDPTGAADENWNRTVCGGIYREEIRGLNRTPIIVEGAFRLNKTLETPTLYSGGVVP
jgi:hypothetical protein